MVPESRSWLRTIQAAPFIEDKTSHQLDLRFPVTGDQINGVLASVAALYRRFYSRDPEASSVIVGQADSDTDEVLSGIKGLRLVEGPFIRPQRMDLRHVPPGIWRLDSDERFARTIVAFVPVLTDSFAVSVEHLVVGMGPGASLEALSKLVRDQAEKASLPRETYTWDDAILADGLAEKIRAEVESFVNGYSLFKKYRLTWKRGLLFHGPAGNGKTFTIRIISSLYRLPTTVFDSRNDIESIDRYIGERRGSNGSIEPRLLILEDIDRVSSDCEAFSKLLSALDGFSQKDGYLVIATANDCDVLDPAIRQRPSRFDRIFEFKPPDVAVRLAYLTRMLGATSWDLEWLAQHTEGFSLAFMKELCLLAFYHQHEGRPPSTEAAKSFVARLRGHLKAGKKIGMKSMDE